jgi:hypothetical protein
MLHHILDIKLRSHFSRITHTFAFDAREMLLLLPHAPVCKKANSSVFFSFCSLLLEANECVCGYARRMETKRRKRANVSIMRMLQKLSSEPQEIIFCLHSLYPSTLPLALLLLFYFCTLKFLLLALSHLSLSLTLSR